LRARPKTNWHRTTKGLKEGFVGCCSEQGNLLSTSDQVRTGSRRFLGPEGNSSEGRETDPGGQGGETVGKTGLDSISDPCLVR
jgi:hypothetical protein